MKNLLTFLALSSLLSVTAHAAPINLSILGPASTDSIFNIEGPTNVCIGLVHCGSETLKGLTVSFVLNTVTESADGIALALGVNSIQGDGRGLQVGLLSNVNVGDFSGIQVGSYNVTYGERLRGAQIGFFGNYNGGRADASQLSFFSNVQTDSMTGVQVSLVNVIAAGEEEKADNQDHPFALQLGLVNVSTQENVVAVGFVNVIKGGRLGLSLDTGVFGQNRISLVSGSKYFYSILHLDDYVLNPNMKNKYHRTRSSVQSIGLGLAVPVTEKIAVRLEYSEHSPTNYNRDSGNLWRLLGEYEINSFLAGHAGVERFRFKDRYFSSALSENQDNYAFTAGVSFNFIGAWH